MTKPPDSFRLSFICPDFMVGPVMRSMLILGLTIDDVQSLDAPEPKKDDVLDGTMRKLKQVTERSKRARKTFNGTTTAEAVRKWIASKETYGIKSFLLDDMMTELAKLGHSRGAIKVAVRTMTVVKKQLRRDGNVYFPVAGK